MSKTNDAKAKQLGMPFGTAAQRLRKSILFKLVQDTNQDTCFKCSKTIETIEELSIEHKEPWFNRNVDLFWDLENIAFSHIYCNVPHTRGAYKLRKIGPEGTAWCAQCDSFLDVSLFYKDAHNWNGYSTYCKVHDEVQRKQKRENRKARGLKVQ